jgi:hypothetical protein
MKTGSHNIDIPIIYSDERRLGLYSFEGTVSKEDRDVVRPRAAGKPSTALSSGGAAVLPRGRTSDQVGDRASTQACRWFWVKN